jgi:hypothetical protein
VVVQALIYVKEFLGRIYVKQNMSVVPREAKQVGHVPGHGPNLCFLNPLWGGG